MVLIVNLGPSIEVDGGPTQSFVAGVWDRPTVTGHYGEQAGYQLYLDVLEAHRLLGVPAGELGNRLVPLADVLGVFAGELTERLAEATDGRGAQHRRAAAADQPPLRRPRPGAGGGVCARTSPRRACG